MSFGAPRWYVDDLIELGICTPPEENTAMNTPKTITREDFDAAMMLLGLSNGDELNLISVHIEGGKIDAEYAQRVKVGYDDAWSGVPRGGIKFPQSPMADQVTSAHVPPSGGAGEGKAK